MPRRVNGEELKAAVIQKLSNRGVHVDDVGRIVLEMQRSYNPTLNLDMCINSVLAVLEKRELQHAILVGIELDVLAEKHMLSEPLQSLVESDEALFGCDETLALGSSLIYGSIAVTTFGYLDKQKTGLIKRLDTKIGGHVHTFLDDLVASIAASAAARVAHKCRDDEESEAPLEVLRPSFANL